jgi:two-component system NarL family sensor kinase
MTQPPIADTSPSATLLRSERHVLELIATGAGLHDVLDALCRAIDEESGLMSAVYVLDRARKQMIWAAGPSVPDAWREATRSYAATPTSGACGAAVNGRKPVNVADVATSPLFTIWREAARVSRIASAWSTPFFSKDGDVLGTFAVLNHEPSRRDAQLHLVDRATYLASIAVEGHQMEDGLRESERRFSTAFYSSPASMTINRYGDGRFMYVNDTFVSMFGYSRAEAVGQTAVGLGLWADPSHRTELVRLLSEHGTVRAFDVKARTKSGGILDLLLWMARIQILGEECVLGITSDISARKRAEEALAQSERLFRLVLDALPVSVAVVDVDGDIILSNPAARQIWSEIIRDGRERYGRARAWWHGTGNQLGPSDWGSVRAVRDGQASINETIDIEAFDGTRKIVRTSAVPIRDNDARVTGAVIVNEDVSAHMTAERERNDALKQLRTLTGRLMRAQDDERRRIAQMLHETTAQDLAALKMHLARLDRTGTGLLDADRAALTESIDLADRSMSGIRTLSYLLHPPFLDEAGLLSAIRWYASGFAARSGIKVDLDLPSTFDRMPQVVETTLFRVVQEALLNIHHHAKSPTALIRLRVDGNLLTLDIEDHGRGMPSDLITQMPAGGGALGVGVAGMRERLQQLGGTLDITSSATGATVRAQMPLPAHAP